jgi:uncharacterized protein
VEGLLTLDALAVLVVAFGVGIVVGLTGMGGGALMTPALIALGVNPAAAVANDLVAASVSKSVGAAVHWRSGSPNLRLAGLLVAGSVPTAFAGGFIVSAVGDEAARTDFLTHAIGAALLLAAGSYALRIYLQLGHLAHGNVTHHDDPHIRTIPTVLVGAVGGLLVGITSVGSGSLIMVTLLILYPRLSAVRLVGTDLLQAVPLVMAAAVGHVLTEGVDWEVLLPLVVGGTPGTVLGARVARTIQQSVIRRGILVVLTVTGLKLLGLPAAWVGIVGGALILLGPIAWGYLRQRRGLPAVDENAAARRVTEDGDG